MGITFKSKALRYLNKEQKERKSRYVHGFETKHGNSNYLQNVGFGLPSMERSRLKISDKSETPLPSASSTPSVHATKKSNDSSNLLARKEARMRQNIKLREQRHFIIPKKPNAKTKVISSTPHRPTCRILTPPASAKSDSLSTSSEGEAKSVSESVPELTPDNSEDDDDDNDDVECIEARPRGHRRAPIPRIRAGMYIHGGLYEGGYYDETTNSFTSSPRPFPNPEDTRSEVRKQKEAKLQAQIERKQARERRGRGLGWA
ncbi:hypothetical protein PG993_011710 [Apiospora rasikravindrae]|uniref:Uncharacterized protein n=1 Tax=Apiospora rasikravindrae TaxID=990691 RepID=A0ABR1S2M6_9PEZI